MLREAYISHHQYRRFTQYRFHLPAEARANSLRSPTKSITDTPSPPNQEWSNPPGPDKLPENRRPPLPSPTQVDDLLWKRLASNLRTWNTPSGMVLRARSPHTEGKNGHRDHTNTKQYKDLVVVLHSPPSSQPGRLSPTCSLAGSYSDRWACRFELLL